MASSQPIVRQINWFATIPQFIILFICIFIYYQIKVSDPLIYGAGTYLFLSLALRHLIPRYHRKGIKVYKSGQFEKAIEEFEKSYDFFIRHEWVDKYRSIVLLSSSRISYLEMAMLNIAFCYGQLGDGEKSKELYEKTLLKFPDSQMAMSSLKMYESAKNIKQII
jgi:tetratricopeptide (TPR) repeat protein